MARTKRPTLASKLRTLVARAPEGLREPYEHAVQLALEAGAKSTAQLVSAMLDDSLASETRASLCWVLGQLRDRRAVAGWIRLFRSDDPELYQEAGRWLGIFGSSRALPCLTAGLAQAAPLEKRIAAAYGLALLRNRRAVPALMNVLSEEKENSRLRGYVAEALALIGDRRAVKLLIRTPQDRSVEVRYWSAYALGVLRAGLALSALEKAATTDKGRLRYWGTVRSEAAAAVQMIRKSSVRSSRA